MATGSSLSKEELNALGVSRQFDNFGKSYYIIPCAICSMPVTSRQFNTDRVYKCKLCKNDMAKKRKAKLKAAKEQAERMLAEDIGVDYGHFHRFEKAAEKFGTAYSKNVETARRALDKFDSTPEVMACIELLHIGARVIVHQRVGDFTVDLCLPDEMVVIEVDGSLYHADETKEQMRDYAISHMLGEGWTIRHVPADAIAKNHSLFGIGMRRLLNARRNDLGMEPLP